MTTQNNNEMTEIKLSEALPVTGSEEAVVELNKRRFIDSLYKQHWSGLCGWLRRRYGAGPPDPEDVAQEAFEKIAAMDNVGDIRNPRAFLYTVAARSALMGVRWLVQARKHVDEELKKQGDKVEEITPERIYMERERFNSVLKEMAGLSNKQREIVIRSRIQGQTYDEICAETGWSPAVISRNLKAAMLALYRAEDAHKGAVNDDNKQTKGKD